MSNDARGAPSEADIREGGAADTRPWRKRHPVLSRVLLFGLGGGLVAFLLVSLSSRQEEDLHRELRGELVSFDILLAQPGGTELILEKLDAQFGDPDLPRDIRFEAARVRAMVYRHAHRRGDPEAGSKADAAFAAALAIGPVGDEILGLALEQTEWHLERGDLAAAEARLPVADELPAGPQRAFTRILGRMIQAEGGAPADALAGLRVDLAALPPAGEATAAVLRAGGRTWGHADVALLGLEKGLRIADMAGESGADLWPIVKTHLALDADALLHAASALRRHGLSAQAATALLAARARDPQAAADYLQKRDPALAELRPN